MSTPTNHTELTAYAQTTIVAFHVGRGGRYFNAGHLSYLGEHKIDEYTNDLFSYYENQNDFMTRYGFDSTCDDQKCILDLISDKNFDELEEKFGITEESLGEEMYFDGGGHPVGLTVAEAETGIGKINIDNEYNTTYATLLSDCRTGELQLIYDEEKNSNYPNETKLEYLRWMLEIEEEETEEAE